jgi:hypothetical protein
MDALLGFELQHVLHLLEAGGEAGLPQVTVDEHEEFVLLAGEHGAF